METTTGFAHRVPLPIEDGSSGIRKLARLYQYPTKGFRATGQPDLFAHSPLRTGHYEAPILSLPGAKIIPKVYTDPLKRYPTE